MKTISLIVFLTSSFAFSIQTSFTFSGNVVGAGSTPNIQLTVYSGSFSADEPGIYLISMNLTRISSTTAWAFVGFQMYNNTTATVIEPAGPYHTYDYKVTSTGYALSRNFIYNKSSVGAEVIKIRWLAGSSSTSGAFNINVDGWDPVLNGWASNFNVIKMKR